MEQTKQSIKPGVPPLPEPKKFEPFVYQLQSEVDPFNSLKLTRVLEAKGSKRNAPNTNRRREPLEAFALDQLKMVGTIRNGKLTYALIEADKSLFQVKLGNYVGQNYGMITAITETEVKIRETVPDAAGEWVERENSLVLQEATKEATK
jgi:type IV pilus assembly protein PilP